MQTLQTIPADTVALEGAAWNGSQFFTTRGDGQPIHPFTSVRTKQGTAQWPQFAPPHTVSTAVSLNARRSISTGDAELWMECEVAGTTGVSAPTVNYSQIGTTVVDETVTWRVKGLHAFKGFSNWPARTNLLLQSEDFTNIAWVKTGATATANTTLGPDGLSTADTMTLSDGLVSHSVYQTFDKAASSLAYTFSVFVKVGTAPAHFSLYLTSDTLATNGVTGIFDLTTGATSGVATVGAGWSTPSAAATKLSNGWWRLSLSGTSDSLTVVTGYGYAYNGSTNTFSQDGGTYFLVGGQLEQAPFASPYIATTTATVTRAATNLSLPTAGNIRSNDFGVDMWVIPGGSGQTTQPFATYTDANNETSIAFAAGTVSARKRLAGVNNDATATYTHAAATPVRVQVYFSSGSGVGVRVRQTGGNWTAWATNANVTAASIATALQVGGANNGNHFAGNYPATRFILYSDPKAELERLAAIDDAWVAGQI